jgi:hypothetical protein
MYHSLILMEYRKYPIILYDFRCRSAFLFRILGFYSKQVPERCNVLPLWWNGRHVGLKIQWTSKVRAGSSPASGTVKTFDVYSNTERRRFFLCHTSSKTNWSSVTDIPVLDSSFLSTCWLISLLIRHIIHLKIVINWQ